LNEKELVMTTSARAACGTLAAALGLVGILNLKPAGAGEGAGVTAQAAFAKLKSIAGEWRNDDAGPGPDAHVVYRVTSNGSVVMETIMPGTDHEMITMYHLDRGELRLTHYCAAGNQPRMKLDKKASHANELRFVFDGGTNLDPAEDIHMHSAQIAFRSGGRIEAEWDAYQGG
jgi:hypothetical protein